MDPAIATPTPAGPIKIRPRPRPPSIRVPSATEKSLQSPTRVITPDWQVSRVSPTIYVVGHESAGAKHLPQKDYACIVAADLAKSEVRGEIVVSVPVRHKWCPVLSEPLTLMDENTAGVKVILRCPYLLREGVPVLVKDGLPPEAEPSLTEADIFVLENMLWVHNLSQSGKSPEDRPHSSGMAFVVISEKTYASDEEIWKDPSRRLFRYYHSPSWFKKTILPKFIDAAINTM